MLTVNTVFTGKVFSGIESNGISLSPESPSFQAERRPFKCIDPGRTVQGGRGQPRQLTAPGSQQHPLRWSPSPRGWGGWFSPNLYRLGCSFLLPPSWPRDSVLRTGLVSFQCISYIGGHTAHLLGQMGF